MIARATGLDKLLAFDMGGTSTDVSVILNGEATISRSTEVGSFPAKVPTLEVRSVGAGGGSIADGVGADTLAAGGPAQRRLQARPDLLWPGRRRAYGQRRQRGSGLLAAGSCSAGAMSLDVDAARPAVTAIGAKLGLGMEAAAEGDTEDRQ